MSETRSDALLRGLFGPIIDAYQAYEDWVERVNREHYQRERIRLLYIEFDPQEQPPALPGPEM
jgi:hypothetical protein